MAIFLFTGIPVIDETIEKDQQELITYVFEISEITAHEAMTPRTEISAVSKNDSLEKVLHIFIDSGHSKLPAYDKNVDNVIGIIYLYDLFNSPENLEDVIDWSKLRYRWVKKNYDRFDPLISNKNIVVYCYGTLYGEWLDTRTFSDIRFIDRFTLKENKFSDQKVWNDLAEYREKLDLL